MRSRVLVRGRVQGVGFRYWTRREAAALGLTGYVRNTASGLVEAEVEGESGAVAVMIDKFQSGPPHARVDHVDVHTVPTTGAGGFAITD
ncbi:hypothetical protein GCM10027344_24140 [Spelaeicoccus albus]|nr:acylphosphatase [Spelaeicoccus albus]